MQRSFHWIQWVKFISGAFTKVLLGKPISDWVKLLMLVTVLTWCVGEQGSSPELSKCLFVSGIEWLIKNPSARREVNSQPCDYDTGAQPLCRNRCPMHLSRIIWVNEAKRTLARCRRIKQAKEVSVTHSILPQMGTFWVCLSSELRKWPQYRSAIGNFWSQLDDDPIGSGHLLLIGWLTARSTRLSRRPSVLSTVC